MFHDDMIMYVIINDQQSFMATINISSAWSTLIIAMNRWEFMHIWTMIIHTCMNSHLFIAMINVDHTDDVLIVAMKDNWSCMKILFIASYHEPYSTVVLHLISKQRLRGTAVHAMLQQQMHFFISVFDKIFKCISPNCKTYFCKLQNALD